MKHPRFLTALALAGTAVCSFAQDAAAAAAPAKAPWAADKADLAWVLVSAALVLLMTPALALFYGGMVRRKNVLSTFMHSFVVMGTISILWLVVGYSFAFGKGSTPYFGGLEYFMGNGVSATAPHPGYVTDGEPWMTVPNLMFMLYQMMFAIITPALISGAIAERMKFSGYLIFTTLWSLLVYCPVAYWVWNPNGWLFAKSALDFAGGTVVHLASGVAALAAAIALGKRKALVDKEPILPNNLTTTLLGAGLLWFGWIGFNAGSALGATDVAVSAFASTHLAAAAGLLGWILVEKLRIGKATALGAASGLVAGLVGITPAAGFVTPASGVIIGLIAGIVCCLAVNLKHKLGYDDSLDVVGVHGVGGLTGAVLTGVFASETVNGAAVKAALDTNGGRTGLIVTQIVGVLAVAIFSFVVSFLLVKVATLLGGVRVSPADEEAGLDLALHGEAGYNL